MPDTPQTQAQLQFPDGTCLKVTSGSVEPVDHATWSQKLINSFPDSSFLYIESGGEKDDEGKTKPRSLRHFPVKDAAGKVDIPHLRNALARIPQSDLPQSVKDDCTARAQRMLEQANEQKAQKGAFEITGRIIKADDAPENPIHEVTSVVLEPNPEDDTQGDTYTEDDVLQAQRSFALSMKVNLMHASPIGKGVYIVENYITRAAFEENGQTVKKGSWIATAQIDEREQPELWAGIKSGAITTWSIEGDGVRTPFEEEQAAAAAAGM